jgi:hypothetical protein
VRFQKNTQELAQSTWTIPNEVEVTSSNYPPLLYGHVKKKKKKKSKFSTFSNHYFLKTQSQMIYFFTS